MNFHYCKLVGLVEYPEFAKVVDIRISCQCVSCYPDVTASVRCCKWRFALQTERERIFGWERMRKIALAKDCNANDMAIVLPARRTINHQNASPPVSGWEKRSIKNKTAFIFAMNIVFSFNKEF